MTVPCPQRGRHQPAWASPYMRAGGGHLFVSCSAHSPWAPGGATDAEAWTPHEESETLAGSWAQTQAAWRGKAPGHECTPGGPGRRDSVTSLLPSELGNLSLDPHFLPYVI